MEFEDKIAIVTGAGSGIGRATALALAREGARLANADGARATALLIGQRHRRSDCEHRVGPVIRRAARVCAYVTSKAAIAGLTRAMAVDLAAHKIRVNGVCPGFVYTGMTAGLADNTGIMDSMRQAYLIKALGQPEDVAEAVLYLLSPRARFVTGSLLVVDGGHIVQ